MEESKHKRIARKGDLFNFGMHSPKNARQVYPKKGTMQYALSKDWVRIFWQDQFEKSGPGTPRELVQKADFLA